MSDRKTTQGVDDTLKVLPKCGFQGCANDATYRLSLPGKTREYCEAHADIVVSVIDALSERDSFPALRELKVAAPPPPPPPA
jgi:hypothetical protein